MFAHVVLCCSCFFVNTAGNRPRVSTEYGEVKGIEMFTFKKRTIHGFMSIPYAVKPLGDLRFEEPKPPAPWSQPLDAGRPPPLCPQSAPITGVLLGTEDCLYLNVYTPVINRSSHDQLLPVVAYIHGGAFYFLSSSNFGPRYLLDYDLLLVTFNYRLGILGFLSTEDETCPGNLGLKDQMTALGWIQRNILQFGGDPSLVTLFGMSAGAVSVHLHYFSILSRGLFHRGYMIGGTGFNTWSMQKSARNKGIQAATSVGCPTNNSREMVQCLKKVPVQLLVQTVSLFQKFYNMPIAPWGPVVDSASKNPFLSELPRTSLLRGYVYNVPMIVSDATNEGLFPVALFIENYEVMATLDYKWLQLASFFLDTSDTLKEIYKKSTLNEIKRFYFGNKPIYENITALVELITDRYYLCDNVNVMQLQARTNPNVFFYMFNYRGQMSSSDALTGHKHNYGASHIDDMYYLLNVSAVQPIEKTSAGVLMIEKMNTMFSKFAKTGTTFRRQTDIWSFSYFWIQGVGRDDITMKI